MPRLAVIGYGAMARYVAVAMRGSDWDLDHCIVREGREDAAEWMARIREAALQDPEGTALDGALETVRSFV